MQDATLDVLRRLLTAAGPSGFEEAPSRVWREEATTFADAVWHDVLGNSFARVNGVEAGPDDPPLIFVGHIDEIGFIIRYIDPEGYLWFAPIGGWDTEVIVGQRVTISSDQGEVVGLVGKKAAHLLKKEDREKPTELNDLWIDIGAADRAEALTRVQVGDIAVLRQDFVQLTPDRIASRCLDNRVGAFLALEAARALAAARPRMNVVAVAATQEETSFGGAAVAAHALAPKIAIALDLTHPTDYPGGDKKANGDASIGGGPVLTRGVTLNNNVVRALAAAGAALGFACPVQGVAAHSWTDADGMIAVGNGTATGLVSVPARYMHSPNEMLSLTDVDQAIQLLVRFAQDVAPDTDFRPSAV